MYIMQNASICAPRTIDACLVNTTIYPHVHNSHFNFQQQGLDYTDAFIWNGGGLT